MAECPPTPGLINSLDPASPTDPDRVFCADDWFRFIQQVIKTNQFPKSEDDSNNGWDIALTVKASEVNSLQGIGSASTVEERLAALEADAATLPGGGVTFMGFFQAAAPTGWQQQTDTEIPGLDNSMMRVVQTAGGGLGGSASPISMAGSDVPQHGHPVTIVTDGNHTHGAYYEAGGGQNRRHLVVQFFTNSSDTPPNYSTGGTDFILTFDGNHNHAGSSAGNNSGPTAWTPKYADWIAAKKT